MTDYTFKEVSISLGTPTPGVAQAFENIITYHMQRVKRELEEQLFGYLGETVDGACEEIPEPGKLLK